jgi:hypothetical protein
LRFEIHGIVSIGFNSIGGGDLGDSWKEGAGEGRPIGVVALAPGEDVLGCSAVSKSFGPGDRE